jgi:hypothetical protein
VGPSLGERGFFTCAKPLLPTRRQDDVHRACEVDRLRDLLSKLREAFRQADWHGLEMEDPELVRAIDAAIGSPRR